MNSICKPLLIIFDNFPNEDEFPDEKKEADVVPVHKKGNKQSLKKTNGKSF